MTDKMKLAKQIILAALLTVSIVANAQFNVVYRTLNHYTINKAIDNTETFHFDSFDYVEVAIIKTDSSLVFIDSDHKFEKTNYKIIASKYSGKEFELLLDNGDKFYYMPGANKVYVINETTKAVRHYKRY